MPEFEPFFTMGELQEIAERRVPPHVWSYIMGGGASETTLRRNKAGLERWALEQRVLRGVQDLEIGLDLFGQRLPMPVLVAPMGSLFRFHSGGDPEMARGAGARGVMSTVSGVCGWPMEDIADAATAPLIFQLYWYGDRPWVQERIRRVQTRDRYKAICLTVDTAVYSRRDRTLVAGGPPADDRSSLPEPRPPSIDAQAALTWKDVEWLRGLVDRPFGLKGINSSADARIALDAGVDFIWISNHGGRQLDSGRATIDVLPEIADVVGGRVPLIVDGGFTRGPDVMKALALGATAVAMGKAAAWGLACGGAEGIAKMLEIIEAELRVNMALSGNRSVKALTPEVLRKVDY